LVHDDGFERPAAGDDHSQVGKVTCHPENVREALLLRQSTQEENSVPRVRIEGSEGLVDVGEVDDNPRLDAVRSMRPRDEIGNRDPLGDCGHMEAAADNEGRGVQCAEGKAGFALVDLAPLGVQGIRGHELVVVERLDDRNPVPASDHDRRDRELRIELVRMDDIGSKIGHEASCRCGGFPIPDRKACCLRLSWHRKGVSRVVRDRRGYEESLVLNVLRACAREKCDFVAVLSECSSERQALPVGAARDVRILVHQ
jgi:hypothetical protein